MQLLSDIVRDTDENFGLGNRAAVLVSEAARSLFDAQHGGLKGFLGQLEAEGLTSDLTNWRDPNQEIRFPEGLWVDKVLGAESITRIGRDLGMANARVRTALAYVIPHLIRYFAAGSSLPDQLPQAVEDYLAAGKPEHLAPRSRGIKATGRKRRKAKNAGGAGKALWAGGVIALLVSGFFLGQDVLTRSQPVSAPATVKSPAVEPVSKEPALAADKAAEAVPQLQPGEAQGFGSKLVLRSYGNQIEYLGFVKTSEDRALVVEKLQKSFGAPRLFGEIVVDAERAEPLWIGQLDRLLPLVSVPGLDVRLEGNTVRVGGWLAEEDRTSVLNNLMSALGSAYRFGYLREEEIERNQDSRQFMLAALAHVSPETKPQDLMPILNHWVISFPEGSATFPEDSRDLAVRVAEALKAAKPQAVVEIQGHVDAEANGGAAQKLSLERANAVRDALTKAGIASGLLRTKGYGSDKRLGTGGASFDHLRNQRIEFRVIQVCDPYFPCESGIPLKRAPQPDPNLRIPGASAPVSQSADPLSHDPTVSVKPASHPPAGVNPASTTDANEGRSGGSHSPDSDAEESPAVSSSGSKLKALSEELPPPPKPRPKAAAPTKPATPKPPEWYDPLGLF